MTDPAFLGNPRRGAAVYRILFSGRGPALIGANRCEEEAAPLRCFQEGQPFDRVCPGSRYDDPDGGRG